ncbi:MAG: hypothetical protein IJR58_03075, partial [Lachnospiraceae bacterium]|nr:hypothetical protein [Lachnospiraceae bacterium]
MLQRTLKTLLFVLFVVNLLVLIYANLAHYTAHLDADYASEAILAREIALNHLSTPDTWYGSTETRIIYPANLAAIFYLITGNMNLSMGTACSVYAIVLIGCMYAFYHRIGLRGAALWSAVMLPFILTVNQHDALQMYVLYAGYYLPVIATTFLTLTFYAEYLQKGAIKPYKMVIVVILAVVLGLQGMRGVLMVYIPLLLAEVIRQAIRLLRERKVHVLNEYRWLLLTTIMCVLSYGIAKHYAAGMTETGRNIRKGFQKLATEVIPVTMELLRPGVNMVYGICVALMLLTGIVVVIVTVFRNEATSWLLLALFLSPVTMMLAMAFTTSEVSARYMVYLFFVAAAGIGILLQHIDVTDGLSPVSHRFGGRGTVSAATANPFTTLFIANTPILLAALLALRFNYHALIKNDFSQDSSYMHVAEWMIDNGYDKGYATFDFANPITVMSNGAVQACAVSNMYDLEGAKWLTNAAWYLPYTERKGPVVMITTPSSEPDFKILLEERPEIIAIERT